MTLRLGTRRSALARTQATIVADRLRAAGHDVQLVEITTFGDQSTSDLTTIGGTGVFAAAIRRALLDGDVDVAVHSLKDLPTAQEPGLVVAAVPEREDPRDVLVAQDGRTLDALGPGSLVGTGAPRRAAQLNALSLGLEVTPVRGNVDTRLQLVASGMLDAVVLARAGLARLGRLDEASETFDTERMLPAPGQGALAVECRSERSDVLEAVAVLEHTGTRACVTAERALLAALEAGCTAPVAALAQLEEDGQMLRLDGFVGTPDGAVSLRRSLTAPAADPAAAGRRLAGVLLEDGGRVLQALGGISHPPGTFPLDGPSTGRQQHDQHSHPHHTEQVS